MLGKKLGCKSNGLPSPAAGELLSLPEPRFLQSSGSVTTAVVMFVSWCPRGGNLPDLLFLSLKKKLIT